MPTDLIEKCPDCKGRGTFTSNQIQRKCRTCRGAGELPTLPAHTLDYLTVNRDRLLKEEGRNG